MGLFGSKTTTTDSTGHPGVPALGSTLTIGSGGYVAMHPPHFARRYDVSSDDSRKIMIAMRLRLDDGGGWPFQHISTALANDKVFVFVVQNGQPVTLEDDASLFPSDRLISQLILLK